MGAGTQTTTTQSNPKPYGPARPLIKTALDDAAKAYNKGIGSQSYTGSTVIPFANQTMNGMNNQMGIASQNVNGRGMSGQLQSILNNGGFTNTQNNVMQGLDKLQNSAALNDTINGDGLNSYARNAMFNWQKDANGAFDLNANPAFQQVQQNAIDNVSRQANAQAAAAGRYGSGVNQQVLSREVGNTAANLANQEYNNWQNRRQSANQNLFSGGNQAMSNQMGAINTKGGLQQSLFNAQQSGLGNMGQAYQTLQDPSKTAMGVGSMYEDLAKRQMDDQLRIFNDKQNAPWNQFNRLLGVAGQTSAYAPKNEATTAPAPNPFLAGLQNVTTGAGLLGKLGLF